MSLPVDSSLQPNNHGKVKIVQIPDKHCMILTQILVSILNKITQMTDKLHIESLQ